MRDVKVNIGFHGYVDFNHTASVSGVIINASRVLSFQIYKFRIFCASLGKNNSKDCNQRNLTLFPYYNIFLKRNTKLYIWHKILWISYKLANSYANIIHIHQKPEIVIGYYLLRNIKTPVIFHIHCHPDAWKGSRWERAFRKSDLVIAVSRFIEDRLIEEFPFLKGKTKVLYNGVDTEMFSPKKKNKGFEIENRFTVFFAGNIWLEKGFDVLLRTAQKLKGRNVEFLIAGSFTPETNPLHKQFEEDSPENVEYLGLIKHDHLPEYYASSNITIVPSKWEEPFGMVVIESMACGTPVIGSRIGGIPELIENKKDGLLVTPESVQELVNAILWCRNHPNKLKEMGVEARKKALKFDWKIISEQLRKIYEELLIREN